MNIRVFLARAAVLLALLALPGCAELARTPDRIVVAQVTIVPSPTLALPPTWTPTPDPTATPEPTPSPTPGCGETAGRVVRDQMPSAISVLGAVPYAIYFPPCYDTRLRYPVAYLMHGSPNFDEGHWLALGLKDALDRAIAARVVPPFLVVLPRGDVSGTFGNTSGGPGSWEQVMLDELIPYIDTAYNTLGTKEGRVIGGISRGAVWALEIAFRNPDRFAAVGGHSSALSLNLAPPVYDPVEIVKTDQANTLSSLRIQLDSGDTDWALQGSAELHALLDERGIPNTFLVGRGAHESAYWTSQIDTYVAFYGSTFEGLIALDGTP